MENKEPEKLSDLMENEDIFLQAEFRIGPFKLLNKIGKGKFATVFLGIHEETKEKVAIKQIKKSELNTNHLLIKEINIQKLLFHPYLTKMYCVIEKEENIYIITEYCSKGDILQILLENGAFEESKSCKIFQQVLSSLEYLHNNNICHRDIKPENILIDEFDDAKLSDFGLSKKFEKNELLNTACGSPIYAAPEMLLGKPYKGSEIDIWSLGISLFTMVCGDFPFDADDEGGMKSLVYNITHGKYTIPEFVSPLCKDLIQKILEINPEKRISIEELKKHQWVNNFGFNYLKSPGVLLDEYYLPVDIYLVKEIKGENEEKIRNMIGDILLNKHNSNTIDYYLKNEIKKRKREKSISDLRASSELFLQYIKDEKSKKKYWGNDINKIVDYYVNQIFELSKKEKMKQLVVTKEIKDSLQNEYLNDNKKLQIIRFKTDSKLNVKNEEKKDGDKSIKIEKGKENVKDNKNSGELKITDENKKKDIIIINNNINNNDNFNSKNNKKIDLEILNLYIGPLLFIHDLIDNIITKVINITEKEKDCLVSQSIKIEIPQKEESKPTYNKNNKSLNMIEQIEDKFPRKTSYQEDYSINKTHIIEFVSTPKRKKNCFYFIKSENLEINSSTKKVKRSESCQIKVDKKYIPKNPKINSSKKQINLNTKNKKDIQQSCKRVNQIKNMNKQKIIKSIDLSQKGIKFSLKKTIHELQKKNKSNSNITHLQINIIKNEIIIADNCLGEKEIGLIKNYSQNYSFNVNKSMQFDSNIIKNKLMNQYNNRIIKNRNKIHASKIHNRSVDIIMKNNNKNDKPYPNNKKTKNYINMKKEIKIPNKENTKKRNKESDNINKFLKSPIRKEKAVKPSSSSSKYASFYSPSPEQGNIKNIFINKKIAFAKNTENNAPMEKIRIIPIKVKKSKNVIFINNKKKDFIDFHPNANNYYNNYIRNKKYQEINSQHNSQLISLFSQPNENESNKINKKGKNARDINISFYKYSKSPSRENIKQHKNNVKNKKNGTEHNNNDGKIYKTEIFKSGTQMNRRNKNNKCHDGEIGEDKLIETKLPLDKIKQSIKKLVGNNVLEGKDNGNFKFICKAKCGKDDLIFHLELISKTYYSFTFKGTLIRGETKFYKDLFLKIKEKLN